jgi:aspartate-semialdehyde dehydrogenase
MADNLNIAVVGATGLVGETMLDILAERKFPATEVRAIGSERSFGKTVCFGNQELPVEMLQDYDFAATDLALFSAGASVSAKYANKAAEAGCVVIDNTSCFRYDDDVPLIVPEVNAAEIENFRQRNLIANPNCSTIQLVVALKPLHDAAGIRSVRVSTYQSVSGAGRGELEDLAKQSVELLAGKGRDKDLRMAFNVWPQIDEFQDNDYTREEMKIVWETRRILGIPELRVSATAVRVPVFFGHAASVTIETEEQLSAERARELLREAPGVRLMDEPGKMIFPTPAIDTPKTDEVFVGRVRKDLVDSNGLNLWIVADNVRKGAALNSIQIAEILVKTHL